MPTTQQLLERRANVWSQMTEIVDAAEAEGRDLSAEERQKYDAAETDLNSLTDEIERSKRHAEHAQRMTDVGTVDPIVNPGNEDGEERGDDPNLYERAFAEYVRRGVAELEGDLRTALRGGWQADKESRAQAVGTASAGGYLVPEGFRTQIVETMLDYGAVARVAQVITTNTGGVLPWPTNNDTGNVGALLAENTQVTEQDLTLGTAQLDAYKYTSNLVRVSLEFLQDVDWMDAEGFLGRKLGERIGRIENQHFTTGTGTAQPNGIVTGATSGVTAASGTAITGDELISLIHSVDPAYRRSNRARFMLSDAALASIRKLKDGNSNYLWTPGLRDGQDDTLLGYGYEVNQDMADPAVGVKSVLFGDFFAGYVIRRVRGIQMLRLDERYADYFQVGFVSFSRADGEVQDGSAYRALTQAAA